MNIYILKKYTWYFIINSFCRRFLLQPIEYGEYQKNVGTKIAGSVRALFDDR